MILSQNKGKDISPLLTQIDHNIKISEEIKKNTKFGPEFSSYKNVLRQKLMSNKLD